MREAFENNSPGYELMQFENEVPGILPFTGMKENNWDFTAYACKAFCLKAALDAGADTAILLDAAFWPIRPISPLVDHIEKIGYFLCCNGSSLGFWSSDRFLEETGLSREEAYKIEEVTSYCVGVSRHSKVAMDMLRSWLRMSENPNIICGPHTAEQFEGRNKGFVSVDPNVRGHRHDQSALSLAAHWWGANVHVPRPIFTAYDGDQDERTVLVNRGL